MVKFSIKSRFCDKEKYIQKARLDNIVLAMKFIRMNMIKICKHFTLSFYVIYLHRPRVVTL